MAMSLLAVFERWAYGIGRSHPRSPWQNGFAERLIDRSGGIALTMSLCLASRPSVTRWPCPFWAGCTTNIYECEFPTGTGRNPPHLKRKRAFNDSSAPSGSVQLRSTSMRIMMIGSEAIEQFPGASRILTCSRPEFGRSRRAVRHGVPLAAAGYAVRVRRC